MTKMWIKKSLVLVRVKMIKEAMSFSKQDLRKEWKLNILQTFD